MSAPLSQFHPTILLKQLARLDVRSSQYNRNSQELEKRIECVVYFNDQVTRR